jgi:hypothetical protein
MAGEFRLSKVGQSAALMAIGLVMEAVVRMQGEKVGSPCSSKLCTNHKGLIKLVAMTLALPV